MKMLSSMKDFLKRLPLRYEHNDLGRTNSRAGFQWASIFAIFIKPECEMSEMQDICRVDKVHSANHKEAF